MIPASRSDKALIVDLLTRSFQDNRSVNYIIPQDKRRVQRIKSLMDYSFEVCYRYGGVYLSENKKACALILRPDKKGTTPASLFLDLRLIATAIGLSHLKRAINREKQLEQRRPRQPLYYLWFIGVAPEAQRKGTGTVLLREIIKKAEAENRILCLETSVPENVTWYRKLGFTLYNELDLGYTLYFLRRETGN